MATYSRREVTKTTVEYVVPASFPLGATWTEVSKAMTAAVNEARKLHNLGAGDVIADDYIWIVPTDDEIVIRLEVPHESVMVRAQPREAVDA